MYTDHMTSISRPAVGKRFVWRGPHMTFNVLSRWDMQFARFFVHNFTTSPYFTVPTSN